MAKRLMVGTPVVIYLDMRDCCVVEDMKQYNGVYTYISKVHTPKTILGRTFPPHYELTSVVSTIGKVPYVFTKDMFIVDEDGEYYD